MFALATRAKGTHVACARFAYKGTSLTTLALEGRFLYQ